MHGLAPLIKDLTIILAVAGLVTLLFHKIRQPVVLGYLIAGMIVGPFTPPHALVNDSPNLKVLAELGVIFLMFSLGLDFSFHKLKRVGFSASVTGLVEVLLMLVIGFYTGQAIGWSFSNSIFLGAALAISSTTIIIKALEELNLKQKRFAELVFGVLIVEDLLAILLLVALSTIVATSNILSLGMLWASIKLVLVVGGWFLVGYFVVPSFFRKYVRYISNETLTIISVALCLVLVSASVYFDYSVALGAFIMGSILAETNEVERIDHLIQPIRDIFAAVFFVSVGMLIDPRVIIQHFPLVLLISAVTVLGKIITSSLGAFCTGQSVKTSLRVGFSMGQIGEFSFIIIGLGAALGALNNTIYPVIVAVSVITTFTTPYLIRFSDYASSALEKRLSPRMKYLIEGYSSWIYRSRADSDRRIHFHKALTRFIINAIVVAIIFQLAYHLLLIQLHKFGVSVHMIDLCGWLIAIVLSAPFLWAMVSAFAMTPEAKKFHLSPLLLLSWIITVAEISLFSLDYFEAITVGIVIIPSTIILFILLYKQLEKSYHWFEQRLVANLHNLKETQNHTFEQLAPWDTHLVQVIMASESPLIGKTLEESQLRQKYGINIVAIHRTGNTLLAPRGGERLWPNDQLVVLGGDEQIDQFEQIARKKQKPQNNYSLENFILKTLLLSDDHPMVGESIRTSNIREKTSGVVVGLERENSHILNPDPATILEAGDLLFIVGEAELLEKVIG
jgi:CPA2 family monovalent cation:H+ antiporter-2